MECVVSGAKGREGWLNWPMNRCHQMQRVRFASLCGEPRMWWNMGKNFISCVCIAPNDLHRKPQLRPPFWEWELNVVLAALQEFEEMVRTDFASVGSHSTYIILSMKLTCRRLDFLPPHLRYWSLSIEQTALYVPRPKPPMYHHPLLIL